MTRYGILNTFIRLRKFESFLEIGTLYGQTFDAVECGRKVSVDPDLKTKATYHMTSDEYFEKYDEKFDIVFIDGLHHCGQVMRDIVNSLERLNPGGVIVMHDCKPTSERMQWVPQSRLGPEEWWTGDVWKAFVVTRATLPYEMYVIDEDMGCGVIDTARKLSTGMEWMPTEMDRLTWEDFCRHPEWFNYKRIGEVVWLTE